MPKTAPSHYDTERKAAAEISGDLTPSDVIHVLQDLRFRNGMLAVRLDRESYIVDALLARRGGRA